MAVARAWMAAVAVILAGGLVGSLAGCGAGPRFEPEILHGFAEGPILRIETERLFLHVPAHRREEGLRIAASIETCLRHLDRRAVRPMVQRKVPVFIPDSAFNNAYVVPPIGGDEGHTVIPPHFSLDFFGELGLSLSPGFVACHEAVHVAHAQQVHGFIANVNQAFGPVFSPQIGLDPWFWEGLAVYYESALNPGMGRMNSPLWRQTFASRYAERRFRAGDLSVVRSDVPWGSWYLNGSHFVEWLAESYGEHRLWGVIDRQSNAFFFPFGIGERFRRVYGRPLGGLVREFADHLDATLEPRERPDGQRVVQRVGREPLWAMAQDGSWAVVSEDLHRPTRIDIHGPDGRRIQRRTLPDLLPPRRVTVPVIAGLAYSPEGDALYFTAFDIGPHRLRTRLLRMDVRSGRLTVVSDALQGGGGDVHPDGLHYVHPRRDTDADALVAVRLADGQTRTLLALPPGHHLLHPRVSPDGRSVVATLLREGEQTLVRIDLAQTEDGGPGAAERMVPLRAAGATPFHPVWIDDEVLLFTHRVDETLQVAVIDREGERVATLTQAPWLAAHPWPVGDRVRFLNLDGFDMTLDEVNVADAVAAVRPPPASVFDRATADLGGGTLATDSHAGAAEPGALPESPAAPLSARPLARVRVIEEQRYRPTQGLFLPRSRFVWLAADGTDVVYAGRMMGYDELGRHAWELGLDWGRVRKRLGWEAGYHNAQLLPVLLSLRGVDAWGLSVLRFLDDEELVLHDRSRAGMLSAATSLRGQPIAAGFVAGERTLDALDALGAGPYRLRLVGPRVSAGYTATRGAARLPVHSGVQILGSAAHFPEAFGASETVSDLRGELGVVVPAGVRRTTLHLRLVERGVPTAGAQPLLRVGGQADGAVLARSEPLQAPALPAAVAELPLSFREPVRGFEARGVLADRLSVGELTWRYSLPIERGAAGLLLVLPSHAMVSVDLALFGAAFAVDGEYEALETAVGGSLDLNILAWLVPLALRYQLSARLRDGEDPDHLLLLRLGP